MSEWTCGPECPLAEPLSDLSWADAKCVAWRSLYRYVRYGSECDLDVCELERLARDYRGVGVADHADRLDRAIAARRAAEAAEGEGVSGAIRQAQQETLKHRAQVKTYLAAVCAMLARRGECHDESKLHSPEAEIFAEYTPKLKGSTYGSEAYKRCLAEMRPALEHHYAENRHHPEHFKRYVCNGCFKEYRTMPNHCDICGYSQFQEETDIAQMTLVDLLEMLCDWKAATLRHADGDILRSIEGNQTRFDYSDDLRQIFENTIALFEEAQR